MARPVKDLIEKRNQLFLERLYLCGICSEVKPLLDFGKHKQGKHGLQANCKLCVNARNKDYIRATKDRIGEEAFLEWRRGCLDKWKTNTRPKRIEHFKRKERESNLKRSYGITIKDFDTLLANQDGRCAICCTSSPQRSWHVDHCHKTNEIRGILCNLCNVGIGAFKENQESLEMARIYLRPRGRL